MWLGEAGGQRERESHKQIRQIVFTLGGVCQAGRCPAHTDTLKPHISGHRHTHSDQHTDRPMEAKPHVYKTKKKVLSCQKLLYYRLHPSSLFRFQDVQCQLFCADSWPRGWWLGSHLVPCWIPAPRCPNIKSSLQPSLSTHRQASFKSRRKLVGVQKGKEKREASEHRLEMQFAQRDSNVQRTWLLRTGMENLAESILFKFPKETLQESCFVGKKMNKKTTTTTTTGTTKLITDKKTMLFLQCSKHCKIMIPPRKYENDDNSTIKSPYCSCRSLEFGSHHPCWVAHNEK